MLLALPYLAIAVIERLEFLQISVRVCRLRAMTRDHSNATFSVKTLKKKTADEIQKTKM